MTRRRWWNPLPRVGARRVGVVGVGDGQLVGHGRPDDGRHLVPAVVAGARADGGRQLRIERRTRGPPGAPRGPRPGPSPAASSRSTMASARAATRAWNRTRPSVARHDVALEELAHGLDQLRRGRHVVRQRRGLGRRGRPRRTARPVASGQQEQQVVLDLAHPPADGGQLDRAAPCPTGGSPAWSMHMTPHLSVPSTSHQAQRVAVDRRSPGSCLVRRRPARRPRRTRRPAASAPNRHARTHSQPRSSSGSPRWASSQSSTARSPSGPTTRLPLRKSPWTTVVGPRRRRAVALEPAEAQLERGVGLARWRRAGRGTGSNWSRAGRGRAPRRRGRCGGCAASASPHCAASSGRAAANSSSRRICRGIVSPSTRSTTIHDAPERRPRAVAGVVAGTPDRGPGRHDGGHRNTVGRRGPQQRRLGGHARGRRGCRVAPAAGSAAGRRPRTPTSPATRRPTAGAAR